MTYKEMRIVQIFDEQIESIPERCPQYRHNVKALLYSILDIERGHAVARTKVVKKMGDRVSEVGELLYRLQRDGSGENGENK